VSDLLSLLWEWRFVIVCILAIVIYALFQWEKFKSLSYEAMLTAKRMTRDKVLNSGYQQEEWVVEGLWNVLPLKIKLILSKKSLQIIVAWLYLKAKDKLDDGYWNGSVK